MPAARQDNAPAAEREPRPVCPKCRRPTSHCFCTDLQPIATSTRVLILQHPRERDVPIGTARLARVGLQNAILRTDVDFSQDPVVRACLAEGNAYLLFPGDDAIDVEITSFPSPITLVVVDGTWWQASKLLKSNPMLAALPRLRLTPSRPSRYGEIRREPAEHCVATIEAIAHVLGHLEKDPERFARLLQPFVSMVERQLYFATTVKTNRHRRDKPLRPPRDPIPAPLRQQPANLICVHGEANAWSHVHPDRRPPETVHWLAKRLATGEVFEAVIAPRGRLAPSTCRHIKLAPEVLESGEGWDAFAERFRRFLRPADVLLSWGHVPLATLAADGLRLENQRLDVRPVVGNVLRHHTGTVEESVGHLGLTAPPPWTSGRGGERLASLCTVVEKLCAWPLSG
jgi:DTW domain-containing protein YfiP